MNIDLIIRRYTAYKASNFKNIRSLAKSYCQVAGIQHYNRVSQENTENSQCYLGENDIVVNFIENKVVGSLAQMLPPDATDREVVEQVKLGGISLAHLIHWASDAQWARVVARSYASLVFEQIPEKNKMDCYHIRMVDETNGNLLQGFITHRHASPHIEDAFSNAAGHTIIMWYGYEKANVMEHVEVYLPV